ncbi:MAG TPA: pyruvate dehydrogenase complex dihydrolipoamide acetyltransferase, partial [Puia sp.]|nr:pyruvate dehydrogenase complex dihydrolipoamide acetyltransferase [Puia sp.]
LLYIGVPAGEVAKVNDIIAIVGKQGEDYKSLLNGNGKDTGKTKKEEPGKEPEAKKETTRQAPASAELPKEAKAIRMPLLSDTMTEGKIVQWNKKVGDKVKSDDVLAEVETDKATMEVIGYEEGTLLYIGVPAGEAAKVNDVIAIVGKEGTDVSAFVSAEKNKSGNAPAPATSESRESTAASVEETHAAAEEHTADSQNGRVKASPLAKKLAAEKGIDISKVAGSGDGGRIIKRDVDAYKPAPVAVKEQAGKTPAVAAFDQTGKEGHIDIPNSQMRKTIARRLGESKFSAPHFYLTMEINMDNAITSRAAINEVSPLKISFNDMVIKACAMALRQHPAVNSSWMGDFIRQNKHIHIGSAVAMPDGLIVPVIRFADQKSLSQIASDAKELYEKARNKKLQPDEFSGNTFTVSNLGMMDIEEFTAIINPPDSAILAIGRIKEIVVKKGDGFGVANVMKVTLSCDHRSIDGAVGAAFLQTFRKFMENPVTMLV